jgi:hypothetical protein
MIQEGLLWFDDNKTRTVAAKVDMAMKRYQQKYGRMPTVCYAHPVTLDGQDVSIFKILPLKSVLPNHFWLGVETK